VSGDESVPARTLAQVLANGNLYLKNSAKNLGRCWLCLQIPEFFRPERPEESSPG
jgi:hypothetical protein